MDDMPVTTVPSDNTRIDAIKIRPESPKKTAADWVRDMRMSSEVNKTTVGVETERVTPELLMATSRKLLGISRREQEDDPKDSLLFQRFYGPAEYFAEHILRDANKVGRNLLWKATNKGNLDFMQSGILDQHISDVFYDSKLAQMIDGSSPLETIDGAYKATRIGEGGVADMDSAPDEMRTVQPSFFGYVDPVRGPESARVGLDMYLAKNCMKGSDGKLYQRFLNARTGKEELVDSVTAAKSVIASPEMMDAKTKSIFALGGPTGVRIVDRKDVDYYLPRADDAYSTAANMVPIFNGVKEQRLLMGCLHPMTTLLVSSKKNEISIKPAKAVDGINCYIPGCTDSGSTTNYPIVNTIAKIPSKKKWFKKIVLKSGRTLITSYDHKWVILKDGKQELVRADKLSPGDIVLRTSFRDVPNRRTFLLDKQVNKDTATLLGCAVRSLSQPSPDKLRVYYTEQQKDALTRALERMGIEHYFYSHQNRLCLGIKDGRFMEWLKENVGTEEDTRSVPSIILSAHADIIGSFLAAYTADETKVGIDSNEDLWVLSIPNSACRDALAFLFARIQTDTLYRDAVRKDGIHFALKLKASGKMYGDMYLDAVKSVLEAPTAPIMIDIDIDDNLYACANGVVTHNSKYPIQAISLDHRETPLVRNVDEATGVDMATLAGKYLGARFAKQGGTVTAVRRDRIDVIYDDGSKGSVALYNNFPMNAKGYIINTPAVKAGQSFKKGDCLASSNYTDPKGVTAIGTNLRCGWVSWKGATYEDAACISESAAKKLTSTTMYKTAVDLDKTVSLGKKNYITWKPGEFSKEQMESLDDNGIIKPGMTLKKGDPMILAVQTSEPSPGTMGKRILTDISERWEHNHPGVVTDVVKTRKGVKVFATVTAPAEVGDKLSGCYGNKGVISQILPDEQMPKGADGRPLEMLFSPLSLVSRTNPAMLHETLLGKVARKTGRPEVLPAFYKGDLYKYVEDRLKQEKLKAAEDLTDPETGRVIPNVITGVSHIYKLKHLSESKMSARGTDEYSADGVPAGGGYSGSKRYGMLEQSAMVGHMALDTILDAKLLRGQSNADFWRSIRTGDIPTIPGEPLVHKKFFAHLIGSGINVRRNAKGVSVFTLSNDDVKELAGPRELKSRDTYEAKTFRPIDGGLFGQDIFGINGDKWGYIQLDEPLPNPVMEEPLARLLRIPIKDFAAVAAGKAESMGLKSSADIKERLSKVNLEAEAELAKQEFKNAPISKKDTALKRYVAIERMRRNGVSPDKYMLDRIPVLPPQFRPISTHSGLTMVADSNYLYAQLLDARDDAREAKGLPEEYRKQARENIYRNWKELVGLYEPENVKLQNKHVQGLLKWALGDSPKTSAFQKKVLGATVDTVGRGVVVPNPRLKINQIGIPKDMAFGIMAPMVTRALVKAGYSPVEAMKQVKAQTPQALEKLKEVMKTHPVQMNRAPTLHKLSIMAFDPVLVTGNAIHVSPSIVVPFGMDYDGDTLSNLTMIVVDLKKIFEKFEKSAKNCLTSLEKAVYYSLDNQSKENIMLAKSQKVMYATACAPLSELPVVEGSEVKKSETVTEWDVQDGFYTCTIDPATGDRVLAKITKVSKHTDLKMYDCEISVSGAFSEVITASKDHSLITYNGRTMQFEKTRPEDSVGKLVAKVKYNDGNNHELCSKYIDIDGLHQLTYDMGVFVGMMLGDGWIDDQLCMHIACCNKSLQEYILNLMTVENAPIPVHRDASIWSYKADPDRFSQNDSRRFTIYAERGFKQAFKKLIGTGAENKRIPEDCLMASRAHMIGLLMGMLATDGSVSYSTGCKTKKAASKTITIHTTSPYLRDGIQELGVRLGIRTHATPYKGKHSIRTCYAVSFSLEDIAREYRKHPKLFVIPMKEKQEALEKIVADISAEDAVGKNAFTIVPYPEALFCEFSYAGSSKVMNPGTAARAHNQGYLNKDAALKLAKRMEQIDWSLYYEPQMLKRKDRTGHTPEQAEKLVKEWINMVRDDKTDWAVIKKVTPATITEGWDCTVPGPYTFTTSSGVVVQDTVNIHVPISDNARKEARERMFPERNLIAMKNREILYKPEKEYMQGLYVATRMKKGDNVRTNYFNSLDEAREAYRKGLIDIDDPIVITNK